MSIICYPFLLFFNRKNKYTTLNNIRRLFSKIFLLLSGIKLNICYKNKIQKNKVYIYCANHTSYLDIFLLLTISKGNVFFIAKKELINLPIVGFFLKNLDIIVDRKNKQSIKNALSKCSNKLINNISIIIFPEGTISKCNNKLSNFKNGAFYLSIKHKIPIIPITIINAYKILYNTGIYYGSMPGTIDIIVHNAIDNFNDKFNNNVILLKHEVYNIIKKYL